MICFLKGGNPKVTQSFVFTSSSPGSSNHSSINRQQVKECVLPWECAEELHVVAHDGVALARRERLDTHLEELLRRIIHMQRPLRKPGMASGPGLISSILESKSS